MKLYATVLALVILVCGLVDANRQFSVGPITLQGATTILMGVGSLALIVLRGKLPKAIFMALGLVLFLNLGVLSLYVNLGTSRIPFSESAQNLLVYTAFVGMMLVSSIEAYLSPELPWYISEGFGRATQIAVCIFLGGTILSAGRLTVISPRSFALFAVVGIAWYMAQWRYKQAGGATWTIATAIAVTASFSRTITVTLVLLFILSRFSPRTAEGWLKLIGWTTTALLVAYLTFTFVEPVRNRFTEKGDSGQLGGIRVSTSGREKIWESVQNSINKAPLIGQGPGSVSVAVRAANPTANGHPHNDYLRLTHDYGYIGLTLWLVGYVGLFISSVSNWLWADVHDRATAPVHLAAILALVGIAVGMFTDNVVVYVFAMVPLGLLAGASIGLGSKRRRQWVKLRQQAYLSYQLPLSPEVETGAMSSGAMSSVVSSGAMSSGAMSSSTIETTT
jgi:O-antigen ligase